MRAVLESRALGKITASGTEDVHMAEQRPEAISSRGTCSRGEAGKRHFLGFLDIGPRTSRSSNYLWVASGFGADLGVRVAPPVLRSLVTVPLWPNLASVLFDAYHYGRPKFPLATR